MLLEIDKIENGIFLKYKSEDKYDTFWEELDKKCLEQYGLMPFANEQNFIYKKEVIEPLHQQYWQSLEYKLFQLLNHLKAITKVYGDFLVLDYSFSGVFLDNDLGLHYCSFDSSEEEEEGLFNSHLIGESLSYFVNFLKQQQNLGDIHVQWIKVELLNYKPVKNKRVRTNIPRGLRHEVFKRDNYTCVECGISKDDGAILHVDHKIPVSKGGTDELDNLQTLCSDCNLNKSNIIQ